MSYNFIKKIKDKEFSFKEDFMQTGEDIENLMLKISPAYRKIGLEKIVKSSEKYFGQLNDRDRAVVGSEYLAGTAMIGLGIVSANPVCFVSAAGCYALGYLHHRAMSETIKDDEKRKD
jgi:hypothetical protein